MSRTPTPTYDPARLRALIAESGLSAREVARRCGAHQPNLVRILQGWTTPRADLLARVLAAIGRGWADLDDGPGA
jgi:transcriptional regulator with XRE-family HTH domain